MPGDAMLQSAGQTPTSVGEGRREERLAQADLAAGAGALDDEPLDDDELLPSFEELEPFEPAAAGVLSSEPEPDPEPAADFSLLPDRESVR